MDASPIFASTARPRGRPGRYAAYDQLLGSLPLNMKKRPIYYHRIGLFRGARDITAWVKVRVPGAHSQEIKLGSLRSWTWEKLEFKRDELQGRADRGEPLFPKASVLFRHYATEWLKRKFSMMKAPDIAAGHIRKHLLPTFGSSPLGCIGVAEINRWIAHQRSSYKASTVQRQFATLNAILNDAVRSGELEKNPAAAADPIRGAEARCRVLGTPELAAVIRAALIIEQQEDREANSKPQQVRGVLADFVLWALHSGMRRQEILNMKWSNIVYLDGVTLIDIPTSKSGQPRHIACTAEMSDILNRLRGRNRPAGDDRIFPVSLTTIKRKLTALWKQCGVADIRLHDLRRTHASELLRAGVDPRTVAGRIGHRDLKMLMRHYSVFNGDIAASRTANGLFPTR